MSDESMREHETTNGAAAPNRKTRRSTKKEEGMEALAIQSYDGAKDFMDKLGAKLTHNQMGLLVGFWLPLGWPFEVKDGKKHGLTRPDLPVTDLFFRIPRTSDGQPPTDTSDPKKFVDDFCVYIQNMLTTTEQNSFEESAKPEDFKHRDPACVKYMKSRLQDLTFTDMQTLVEAFTVFQLAMHLFRLKRTTTK